MLLSKLGSSLLGNLLTGRGAIVRSQGRIIINQVKVKEL